MVMRYFEVRPFLVKPDTHLWISEPFRPLKDAAWGVAKHWA
jgi:hypothetical protein